MKKAFTLIEVSAAAALLTVCALMLSQLILLTSSERLAERTRRTAVDQVQNVLEYLAATEPEKLVAGEFDQTPYESLIERSLPDGKIVFDTKMVENGTAVFIVTVSWSDGKKRHRKNAAMFRLLSLPLKSPPPM